MIEKPPFIQLNTQHLQFVSAHQNITANALFKIVLVNKKTFHLNGQQHIITISDPSPIGKKLFILFCIKLFKNFTNIFFIFTGEMVILILIIVSIILTNMSKFIICNLKFIWNYNVNVLQFVKFSWLKKFLFLNSEYVTMITGRHAWHKIISLNNLQYTVFGFYLNRILQQRNCFH